MVCSASGSASSYGITFIAIIYISLVDVFWKLLMELVSVFDAECCTSSEVHLYERESERERECD
jgi:hypothetical protein